MQSTGHFIMIHDRVSFGLFYVVNYKNITLLQNNTHELGFLINYSLIKCVLRELKLITISNSVNLI